MPSFKPILRDVVTALVTIALAILAEHYIGLRLAWAIVIGGVLILLWSHELHAPIGAWLLSFWNQHRFRAMSTFVLILVATIVSLGIYRLRLPPNPNMRFIPTPEWASKQNYPTTFNPPVRVLPIEHPKITLAIGSSLNPKFAFETRFILTNHSSSPLTQGGYICLIPNGNPSGILHFDKPTNVIQGAGGQYEDLPPDQSRSLYCDFVMAESLVNTADPLVVDIFVSYTYKSKEGRDGFKFFAKHTQDGTFVWYPGGAAR